MTFRQRDKGKHMPEEEHSDSTYFIDQERLEEMSRLSRQASVIDRLVPTLELIDCSLIHDCLDLACGPGTWSLRAAQRYPAMNVTGIDISKRMIHFAQTQAKADRILNVDFQLGNVMQPLPFPDQSMDYIHARLLQSFLRQVERPRLLQECWRILRPGGFLCLIECDRPQTNSPTYTRLNALLSRAFLLAGMSASPDGEQWGVVHLLGQQLLQAGFAVVQKNAYVSDYSYGSPDYAIMCQNTIEAFQQLPPFLEKFGGTPPQDVQRLCIATQREMAVPDFCAIVFALLVTGRKP